MASKQWPMLYKKTSTGDIQGWRIEVIRNDVGEGVITITYGKQGGKPIVNREVVSVGKNLGKKNATNAYEQAVAEAQSRWEKQQNRKHYSLDATGGESADKRCKAPMLAPSKPLQEFHKEGKLKAERGMTYYLQPKLDGYRCLGHWDGENVVLVSREGKVFEAMKHIEKEICRMLNGQEPCILDGELWTSELRFGKIQSAIKKLSDPPPYATKIQYHLYDMHDVDAEGFEDRYRTLKNLIPWDDTKILRLVRTHAISGDDADAVYVKAKLFEQECVKAGFEGAMLRRGDMPYEPSKRSVGLLKVKSFIDQEFKVVAWTKGKASAIVGAEADSEGNTAPAAIPIFICETTPGGPRFEATAPGTLPEKRALLEKADSCIGKLLTVKFFEWTEDKVPRMPVAKAFRD